VNHENPVDPVKRLPLNRALTGNQSPFLISLTPVTTITPNDLMLKDSTDLSFLSGGGEMGERMRAFDWSSVQQNRAR
jgi:hypothetical protein